MLTRELAIATFDGQTIVPDRLTQKSHADYLAYAARMLDIYRNGVGQTRRVLHRNVHDVFTHRIDCPARRISAFCKLLDEVSEYTHAEKRKIVQLRQSAFRSAAKKHPLVTQCDSLFENQESEVKRFIAFEHGMSWPELSDKLFSDLIEYHELKSFQGYDTPQALLSRYNVAQTQAVLFDAVQMTVHATQDFKTILRHAKLARLLYRVYRSSQGYRFEFGGASSLLRSTHRYGPAMARFLPGLLSCKGWSMRATLRGRGYRAPIVFCLDDACGLTTGVARTKDFDSSVEQKFFEAWGTESRNGWQLERETEILNDGQTAFFPDFVLVHESGLRVLLEIIGFWTPEYLQEKARVLETFRKEKIVLAIAESLKQKMKAPAELPVIYFKDHLKPSALLRMEALNVNSPSSDTIRCDEHQ